MRGDRRNDGAPDQGARGGIELITPSLISGWVFHPLQPLTEVRLLLGPHLIAHSRIDRWRPDVEEHLKAKGIFGFQLEIPADLPALAIASSPEVLALSADGQQRIPLQLLGTNRQLTADRLRTALRPEFRGLRGHFDGLSPDGLALQGWCYTAAGGTATVWLHADGLPTREILCDQLRPGMTNHGHPDRCGFALALADWPEAAGREIRASFDRVGELLLPQVGRVVLPLPKSERSALSLEASSSAGLASTRILSAPTATTQESVLPLAPTNYDLQEHWRALEEFRLLIDRIEAEVQQAEKVQPLVSKRSARFRLWR